MSHSLKIQLKSIFLSCLLPKFIDRKKYDIMEWTYKKNPIVSDITYIPTDEGQLYTAVVKDLCLKKIVGYAFSSRIDLDRS